MSVSREDIIAAARRWIDTPYLHQSSLIHVGCDCLGLVRGVWREVVGEEPERAPPYTADWAEAQGAETLLDAARRAAQEALLDRKLWRPDAEAFDAFVKLLDAPPQPSERLRKTLKTRAPWE